jgi:hypothetical protein
MVTNRQPASLFAERIENENKTEQLQTTMAHIRPAAHASSRPDAPPEHGDV